MTVVDSSGWIEYLQGGSNAGKFLRALSEESKVIVPTIVAVEVLRFLRRELGEDAADATLARMNQCVVVELDLRLAAEAAVLGYGEKLAIADSIILATARHYEAELWTQDEDFDGLAGVRYFPKTSS